MYFNSYAVYLSSSHVVDLKAQSVNSSVATALTPTGGIVKLKLILYIYAEQGPRLRGQQSA